MLYNALIKQGAWLFRHRGIIPFLIIIPGFGIYEYKLINQEHYSFYLNASTYQGIFWGCFALSMVGLAIRAYTIGFAAENTSGRNVHQQIADHLNTTGIYSIIRHPLYVGNFFMWLGVTLFFGHLWFVIFVVFFFILEYERIMLTEEAFLSEKFGDTYREWASRVPAVIPNFRIFKKPYGSFNWKKVLKQEKNGLIAVMILFSVIDVLPVFFNEKHNVQTYFHVMTVFFVVLYVIYKIFKMLKKITA